MSARKRNKAKRQRKANRRKHSRFEGLERKLKEGVLKPDKILVEPERVARMSEVLEEFAMPFLGSVETLEECERVFSVAVLAWNVALFPEDEQGKTYEAIIDEVMAESKLEDKEFLKNMVSLLIARKNSRFAEYNRFIIDLDITSTPTGFNLKVASTLEKDTARRCLDI